MKIKSLQISNILSFKHFDDICNAPKISFDDNLNIIIGHNGSGKSTALEVINFTLNKALFFDYEFNKQNIFIPSSYKRTINARYNSWNYSGFRLGKNENSSSNIQTIRLEIEIDEIDKNNLSLVKDKINDFSIILEKYSDIKIKDLSSTNIDLLKSTIIDIVLDAETKQIKTIGGINIIQNDLSWINNLSGLSDDILNYFLSYGLYARVIELNNIINDAKISLLAPTYTMLSAYRNYGEYNPGINLNSETAADEQIEGINTANKNKSVNSRESSEPSIFNYVRLRLAKEHSNRPTNKSEEWSDQKIKKLHFFKKINSNLKILNLSFNLKLVDRYKNQYSFNFINIKTNKELGDINNLSSGQKSLLHIIFEAYGRDNLKGGVIVIDEPEIHLHDQFQKEYIKIIEDISKTQKCQYILVTHSDSFIYSKTIDKIKRFSLNDYYYTDIFDPSITSAQKNLIKIIDNTRSAYALFAKKVILVEGDTDRYFFKALIDYIHPELSQEIAVLDIGGKSNYNIWKDFFDNFGLKTFYIGDLDNVFDMKIISTPRESIDETIKQRKLLKNKVQIKNNYNKLASDINFLKIPNIKNWNIFINEYKQITKTSNKEIVKEIRKINKTIDIDIESKYVNNVFILKYGSIDEYTGTTHKDQLPQIIEFCAKKLESFVKSNSQKNKEIKKIINTIVH